MLCNADLQSLDITPVRAQSLYKYDLSEICLIPTVGGAQSTRRAHMQTRSKFPAPPIKAFPDVKVFGDEESDESDIELFDPKDTFSVSQDLLLVRNWCFEPDISRDELVVQFRREFGSEKNAVDIERRLQILQSDELHALLLIYLKSVVADQESNGGYGNNASSLKPPFQALMRHLRPSCETKLLQLIYDDEKSLSESSEMTAIDVSSRNFPKYSRLVQKRQLERSSKVIHDLFRSAEHGSKVSMSPNQGFSLHTNSNGTERLQFTDSVPYYDSCMVFNHLEQPILDRFIQFAKDPNVMERLRLQKQQLVEQKQIQRELTHQLQGIFSSQQKVQREKLEEARTAECEAIKQHLEQMLENDILHLRRMHETLLKHECAKINARFDEHIFELSKYIAATKNEVSALHNRSEMGTWNNLEQDIARSTLNVERIFGTSDYILRLLILAEDLDAEPLRRALIHYLGRENALPQFALRREFTSKMIPESTVLAILKVSPTKDLRELEGSGKAFVYHELVSREIHTRRITFSRFIAMMTNDQLRVVSRIKSNGLQSVLEAADEQFVDAAMLEDMKAVDDFPDVLKRELARRREFSYVKMNSAEVDREISFSEDDCVLQLEASHRYCSVFATKERKQGESGRWMFEATVEIFGGEGESLLLGWEVPRLSTHEKPIQSLSSTVEASSSATVFSFVPGITPGTDGHSYGVTWQSDGSLEMGILHANGQSKSGVACFRAGDVIGCTINQDELMPYLRFYLNGVQVIPPLTTVSSGASQTGVACQNPVYCLFPVVSMYSSRKKPQMRIRFNFHGNFCFPLGGFEPYGAPV